MVKKQVSWTPREASPIYWLITWGLSHKDVLSLVMPLLPNRSKEAIANMATEIRKQLSILRKLDVGTTPIGTNIPALVREASKIEPIRDIKDLRPLDMSKVEFIPMTPRPHTGHNSTKKPNNELVEQNPPKVKLEYYDDVMLKVKNTEEQKGKFEVLKKVAEYQGGPQSVCGKDLVDMVGFEEVKNKADSIPWTVTKEEPSLEEVLATAKKVGATTVYYKDYKIKFV